MEEVKSPKNFYIKKYLCSRGKEVKMGMKDFTRSDEVNRQFISGGRRINGRRE